MLLELGDGAGLRMRSLCAPGLWGACVTGEQQAQPHLKADKSEKQISD